MEVHGNGESLNTAEITPVRKHRRPWQTILFRPGSSREFLRGAAEIIADGIDPGTAEHKGLNGSLGGMIRENAVVVADLTKRRAQDPAGQRPDMDQASTLENAHGVRQGIEPPANHRNLAVARKDKDLRKPWNSGLIAYIDRHPVGFFLIQY
jgi:hypothetical protein